MASEGESMQVNVSNVAFFGKMWYFNDVGEVGTIIINFSFSIFELQNEENILWPSFPLLF